MNAESNYFRPIEFIDPDNPECPTEEWDVDEEGEGNADTEEE
jgi:hypothetical protein